MTTSNVIKLPTAAPRKVQQRYNRHTRAEKAKLREASPWPTTHISPSVRQGQERAAMIMEIDRTPTFQIIMALLACIDRDTQLCVRGRLSGLYHATGNRQFAQALAAVISAVGTVGEQYDIHRALEEARS